MQGVHLRKYGVSATIDFELFEVDGVDFRVDAVYAAGDVKIMKDEGVEANTTNGFTDEGTGYSIVLTATEMQAARIILYVVDQTATKVWLDTRIVIETYGNASAQHAVDLDDSVRAGLTALPNAAADAAGGLPISDAGGLDLDAQIGTDIDAILVDTADMQPKLGTPAGASISADIATVDGNVDAILVDTADMQPKLGTPAVSVSADIAAVPTAAQNADAVWDEAKAGHVGAGSFGEEVQAHALSSEISALNDLSAAQVNAEVDAALDTAIPGVPTANSINERIKAIDDKLPSGTISDFDEAANNVTVGAVNTDAIDAVALAADAANEIADALLDRATAVEGYTPRQILRLFAAALIGKANGLATTTANYRDVADTKNRIVATVDADGNRSAVTLDAS